MMTIGSNQHGSSYYLRWGVFPWIGHFLAGKLFKKQRLPIKVRYTYYVAFGYNRCQQWHWTNIAITPCKDCRCPGVVWWYIPQMLLMYSAIQIIVLASWHKVRYSAVRLPSKSDSEAAQFLWSCVQGIQSDPPCYINKSAVFWHLWAKCMAKCRKSSGRLEMCKTIIDHHNVQNHLHAIHDPAVVSRKGNM